MEIIKTMAEFSDRHFRCLHIAGFIYYVSFSISGFKTGKKLQMLAWPSYTFDLFVVEIGFDDKELGFIPKTKNKYISKFLNNGYNDIIEMVIQRVNLETLPAQQVFVVINVR